MGMYGIKVCGNGSREVSIWRGRFVNGWIWVDLEGGDFHRIGPIVMSGKLPIYNEIRSICPSLWLPPNVLVVLAKTILSIG